MSGACEVCGYPAGRHTAEQRRACADTRPDWTEVAHLDGVEHG